MQQIADWLEKLGMSEYAQRFADNGIDVSVAVPHLTDQDLKDIGVLLGHRAKTPSAIAVLSGPAPTALQPVAATGPKTRDTAERRYLTVMFCDLIAFDRHCCAARCRRMARPWLEPTSMPPWRR